MGIRWFALIRENNSPGFTATADLVAERVRFLPADERDRLLKATRVSAWPKLYLLVVMALVTGARRGELLALRWPDVELEAATALVGRGKNGEPRVLPLTELVIKRDRLSAPARRHAPYAA